MLSTRTAYAVKKKTGAGLICGLSAIVFHTRLQLNDVLIATFPVDLSNSLSLTRRLVKVERRFGGADRDRTDDL